MAIWTNWIVPIFTMCSFLCLGAGILFLIYFILKKINPDIRWWFKYSVFRFKHDENDVEFCMRCLEKDKDETDVQMLALLTGTRNWSQAREMVYVFKQIKKLKGGK